MHNIVVEKLFTTPEQIEKGLMYDADPLRPPPDDGVALFMFPSPKVARMWMKNTPRSLDMLFIRTDHTVDSLHEGARPYDETIIQSDGPVAYAVEALAGYIQRHGIAAGDKVQFSSAVDIKM